MGCREIPWRYRGKSFRIHYDTVGYLGIPWGFGGIPCVAYRGKSVRYTPWDTIASLSDTVGCRRQSVGYRKTIQYTMGYRGKSVGYCTVGYRGKSVGYCTVLKLDGLQQQLLETK